MSISDTGVVSDRAKVEEEGMEGRNGTGEWYRQNVGKEKKKKGRELRTAYFMLRTQ